LGILVSIRARTSYVPERVAILDTAVASALARFRKPLF
jgi:hypothetical protein